MINQQCSTSSSSWSLQLKRTHTARAHLLSRDDTTDVARVAGEEFLNHVRSMNEDIRQQIAYGDSCCVETTTSTPLEYKQLRSALRVALCCLSIPPQSQYHHEVRRTIQQESFDVWHSALLAMIMNKYVDESCRLLAAQVLCNTITDCIETASQFMNDIPPAPTDTEIADKLRHDVVLRHSTTTGTTDVVPTESTILPAHPINWMDLILNSTTSRPLLAVVVACLHNCICSMTNDTFVASSTEIDKSSINDSIHKVAASTLLISTLLRHIVSALFVQPRRNADATTTTGDEKITDDATEWISLLISKLCRLGLLPEMYRSIANSNGKNDSSTVYPEHVVLLHAVRNIVEEGCHDNVAITESSIDVDKKSPCYCLGGEIISANGQSMIDSHCFLAELYVTISSESPMVAPEIDTLQASVLQLVLDILAESLSGDNSVSNRIRHIIGSTTTFLQSIICDLAESLDQWHETNKALFARDQAKMNEIDQCRITASVRVIGNICFQCRQNQDLLRSIIVPNTAQRTNSKSEKSERNGLHVLLSTTSMSYACFTLREWAVVAIRSVLEDCPENQAIVLELEGHTAMQTADLEEMGIRVNLNVPTGTVTVDQLHDK